MTPSQTKRAYTRARTIYYIAALTFAPLVILASVLTYWHDREFAFWGGIACLTLANVVGAHRLGKARDAYLSSISASSPSATGGTRE